MTSTPTVLIVGGGPVGLVLACELRLRSIGVRVVDNRPGPTAQSRAIVVWPRSLELLRRIGAAEPLVAAGNPVTDIVYYSGARRLGAVSLAGLADTPYPFGTTIPQVRTEAVLAQRLAELGGTVESGTSLIDLRLVEGRPLATLQAADGSLEQVEPAWLIGADGSQSTVRGKLGIEFEPIGGEISFAICDGTVVGDLPSTEMVYAYRESGALGLAPLGGSTFRVAFAVSPDQRAEDLTQATFQQQLDRLSPVPARLTDMRWCTVFKARRRLASSFGSGSVYLAGDAAHIFSAAGAQGMNTGIQDAVSLGWRLAGAITGQLSRSVLDGYEPERRAEAIRLSTVTAKQTEWGLLPRRSQRVLRDVGIRLAERTGVLQRLGAPLMSQTDVSYRAGGAVSRVLQPSIRIGDRLPVFPDSAADADAEVRLLSPALLLWPGDRPDAGWASRVAGLRAAIAVRFGAHLEVLDAAGRPELRGQLGSTARAVVLRPDSHVAALTDGLTVDNLIRTVRATGCLVGDRQLLAVSA